VVLINGICRNRTLKGETPAPINSAFLRQLYDQPIPYSFEERARHFLQYLYDNGGKTYQPVQLNSTEDCPIAYSNRTEFENIIRYLKNENWIRYDRSTPTIQTHFYQGMTLEKKGREEIEQGLPKMPLFGLVNQQIATGDPTVDMTIEHARILFFGKNNSLDHKRSACEALIFILEPLRKTLDRQFQGDTEKFFRIVNEFSIRHNKERTQKLEHEEQLEWIFYSLLNTINTYTKMKNKLGVTS
jgi:hypothetical protein